MRQPLIISTRILEQEHRAIWCNSAIKVVEYDFITVNPIAFILDEVYDYVLFTSQNAVKSVLNHVEVHALKEKPAFCVGVKTKALLEQNGWEVLEWADYAKELAPILTSKYIKVQISFFNGNLRSVVLPTAFAASSMVFNEFQVYETELTPTRVEGKADGICFYSPSGVQSYLEKNSITDEVCFCIGDTTAEALKDITNRIVLAAQPTIEKTLEACIAYYK